MSLRDCLTNAVQQGALNQRQADELETYFNERFKRNRKGMGDAQARADAKRAVAADLRAQAELKKKQAVLTDRARQDISQHLDEFRDFRGKVNLGDAALSVLAHYGTGKRSSYMGRRDAIMAVQVMPMLSDLMEHFRRTKITGRRINKIDMIDLMAALFNEDTIKPVARAFADAIRQVNETLRQRFNAAGGAMPKREGYDLPHSHDPSRIRKLGATPQERRAKWKAFIRPLIDPDQMVNPHTGEEVGADGIEEALDYAFDSIMSNGAAHMTPQSRATGTGSLANRYQDGRFFVFKDAASWMKYNDKLGNADPIATMFNHWKSLANDIAAMEILGPNPRGMIEWLKQIVEQQRALDEVGRDSVAKGSDGLRNLPAGWGNHRIDALYGYLRGRETAWNRPATMAGDVRNVATAAMLGATGQLAAATDPAYAAAARRLAGLPVTYSMGRLVKELVKDARGAKGAKAAARRGILWDDYMNALNEEARFVDQMFGSNWSRVLVDRALTVNGLKPLTNARKRIEAGAWHETLGGMADKDTDWIDMPDRIKRVFEGFGLGADDWHTMRKAVDEDGFLDPAGVARSGNGELAERYAELINGWNERSVPAGDVRIKSALSGNLQRGTLTGEFVDFATQFLSFGMSFTARQLEAIYMYSMTAASHSGRISKGAHYFAAMAIPLTLGAAFYTQLKAIQDGKDPLPMDNASFWLESFVKGGGGGLFADFVARSENRFGGSFQESVPGPGVAFIGDTLDMTLGTIFQVLRGEDNLQSKVARKGTNYLSRYTPILSSHPMTRLAYRRAFIDQLQLLSDPQAEKSFQAKKRRHSYFVPPGEGMMPDRRPDFGNALNGSR